MHKILNAEAGKHIVQSYSFQELDTGEVSDEFQPQIIQTPPQEVVENVKEHVTENNNKIDDSYLKLIEQLLQKSDDLSSSVEKLEQQLQSQAQNYEKRLDEMKEISYKDGFNDGYNKAKSELENKINEHLSKLIESLHKIDEVYQEYQTKAENIEKELIGVAVDIAEQVIAKEVSKSSKEIALSLTKELLNDIKEATKIEIKLNPLDYDYVKENLNLEKVKITPDNAISSGGVVILSDAGNIEGEIHERFKNVKQHLVKG